MEDLVVSRVVRDGLQAVGTIARSGSHGPSFSYIEDYLELEGAVPLSQSLPCRREPYSERELRAYFDGLLPEGPMREALAVSLAAREQDYLTLLECSGLDCIGDVVVRAKGETTAWDTGTYLPLDKDGLVRTVSDLESLTASNVVTRLSLAGTQGKVGLAHIPHAAIANGWMRPEGGAASTHILKTSAVSRIEELELLCMLTAESCGIQVAHTDALMLGKPIILSERYDRRVECDDGQLRVERLHQEDLAQAFGVTSSAKYLELEGGTYRAIANLLYENSSSVLEDITQLARVAVFDYLVGNCDNHLKNLSIMHEGRRIRLAPAYDLVCTTYFERFSREMGMRLGSTRSIDAVTPDDFDLLAQDIGMGTKRMRRICKELRNTIVSAVLQAGERLCSVVETLPYTAEDFVDDMAPRLAVLSAC